MTFCNHSNQKTYPFTLPSLPYSKDDFKPYLSAESFDYHYEKHHKTYVTNLNDLIKDNPLNTKDLETIIQQTQQDQTRPANAGIFNNAAQIWNHSFFWNSIKPKGGGKPEGEILQQIVKDFGSYDEFKSQFKQAATSQFGSGWAWLVYKDHKLHILKTANAQTPITEGYEPILACDVWEHAYYIDYRNKRPDYVTAFIDHLINWDFANLHYAKATKAGS